MPETEEGDLSNYPGEWVEAHTVAHSVMEIKPEGGTHWALYKGPYTDALLTLLD